ncbi:MAG: hypothetical protein ACTHU7_12150 [Microbacterium sp.]
MRGKVGLVIGLGVGYVLGTRAGRQRYEQIKTGAEKVWHLDPVQEQVGRAKDLAATSAMKLPRVAWDAVAKIAKTAANQGSTPGEKLDATIDETKESARDIKKAATD